MPLILALLAACTAEDGYQLGVASWYGPGFENNLTASGEPFDPEALSAAHLTLPFGTVVDVVRVDTEESVQVVVNDRGPYVDDRILDLSKAAAESIGVLDMGLVIVELRPVN
jgi:rare lipoprotein A